MPSYTGVYQLPKLFQRSISCTLATLGLLGLGLGTAACDPAPPVVPRQAEPARTPHRIVSLSPDVSRVLIDLGVGAEIIAADSVSVALSGMNQPLDLGMLEPSLALPVSRLDPGVAIGLADDRSRAFASRLSEVGVRVVLLAPRTANEVDAAVLRIGALVGLELRARALIARVARVVSQVATRRDGATRLQVALVIDCDPLTVVGGAGLIHETLELAGAENVFHEPDLETRIVRTAELVERAPEVVLDASGANAMPACIDVRTWGGGLKLVPAALAAPLGLDLQARVQSLHEILYGAPPEGNSPER